MPCQYSPSGTAPNTTRSGCRSLRGATERLLLALATIAVVLRLNLLFTSRVHLPMLVPHRARLFPWVVAAEGLLALALLGSALALGNDSDATAAPLLSIGLILVASLAIIEPATTSGAGLRSKRE